MDLVAVLASERRDLADELDQLTPTQWDRPSLCDGWSNHVVAAHLNLPWEVRPPAFVVGLVRARGSIDRAMDRFSRKTAARLDPQGCVDLLRANATSRFTPPGIGVEARSPTSSFTGPTSCVPSDGPAPSPPTPSAPR